MHLDEAQLNALPAQDRARYMALEHLFAQPGWKIVVALAKTNAEAQVRAAAFAKDWASSRLAIGNGSAWDQIAKLEEQTEAAYAEMLASLAKHAEENILVTELSDANEFE